MIEPVQVPSKQIITKKDNNTHQVMTLNKLFMEEAKKVKSERSNYLNSCCSNSDVIYQRL